MSAAAPAPTYQSRGRTTGLAVRSCFVGTATAARPAPTCSHVGLRGDALASPVPSPRSSHRQPPPPANVLYGNVAAARIWQLLRADLPRLQLRLQKKKNTGSRFKRRSRFDFSGGNFFFSSRSEFYSANAASGLRRGKKPRTLMRLINVGLLLPPLPFSPPPPPPWKGPSTRRHCGKIHRRDQPVGAQIQTGS